jgi:hypothetical protein
MATKVYVLTNEAMPGLVKIGMTTGDSVESRMNQLHTTGVPLPFDCHYAGETDEDEVLNIERVLHQLFSEYRINPKREFFRIEPEKVVLALSLARLKDVTLGIQTDFAGEQEAVEVERAKKSRLSLEAIGISIGSVLTLSRDPSIQCTVVAGNRVDFKGEIVSLSAAALSGLHSLGYKTPVASGPGYWMYGDKTLGEIRRESEERQFGAAA